MRSFLLLSFFCFYTSMFEVSGRPLPQENVAQALTLNALTSFSSSPSPISRPNTTIPSVDNTRMSASLLSNTSTLPLVGVAGNAGGVFNVSSGVLPTLSSTPTQPQVANVGFPSLTNENRGNASNSDLERLLAGLANGFPSVAPAMATPTMTMTVTSTNVVVVTSTMTATATPTPINTGMNSMGTQSTSNRITSGANAINVPMNGLNRNVQVVLSVPMMNTPFLNPTSNFFTSNQGFTSFPLTGLQNPVLQNPTSPFGINSFTSPVIPLNGGVNAFNGFRVQ